MNKTFNRLLLWAVVSASAATAPALAQIPGTFAAGTPDELPDGGQPANERFVHTGTDATSYNGKALQVMTWDDGRGNVTLSWDVNNRNAGIDGHLTLSGNHDDPDVVVGYRNGGLYANLVCIDTSVPSGGQAVLFGYKWTGNGFSQSFGPVKLGNPDVRHAYPNIDANEDGFTAIVWQQTKESKTTVTVSSPDFPAYTFMQTVAFSRSFLAGSMINTGVIGSCYRYTNQSVTQSGTPVIDPPKGLFEQTLRPDVAISESRGNEPPVVSTTFIRHFVDGRGNFAIVDSLDVKQTLYNVCEGGEKGSKLREVASMEWWLNPALSQRGAPRIAATPSQDQHTDVEVVLDAATSGCFENVYEVHNWGKSGGTFRPNSTLVSLPDLTFALPNGCQGSTNLRKREATEPVVSYYSGRRGEKGYYIVSWTGYNYTGIDPNGLGGQGERDVWSSTLIDGVPEFSAAGTTIADKYSAINDKTDGNQHTPSVAGRHSDGYTAHLFVNDLADQLSFKQSVGTAGSTPMRPGGGATSPAGNGALLQAFPNPSEGNVAVQLQLHPGESVRQLTVVDQLGRTVDRLPVASGASEASLSWKPAANLPTGTYVLKLVTTERTANLTLSRK